MSRGAVASVFALALAFPVATATSASADPNNSRVVLQGSVDCGKFGSFYEPTRLAVSSSAASNSRAIQAAGQPRADYAQLALSPVPEGPGIPASATLTCTNSQNGRVQMIVENFTLVRPPGNTVISNLDIF